MSGPVRLPPRALARDLCASTRKNNMLYSRRADRDRKCGMSNIRLESRKTESPQFARVRSTDFQLGQFLTTLTQATATLFDLRMPDATAGQESENTTHCLRGRPS